VTSGTGQRRTDYASPLDATQRPSARKHPLAGGRGATEEEMGFLLRRRPDAPRSPRRCPWQTTVSVRSRKRSSIRGRRRQSPALDPRGCAGRALGLPDNARNDALTVAHGEARAGRETAPCVRPPRRSKSTMPLVRLLVTIGRRPRNEETAHAAGVDLPGAGRGPRTRTVPLLEVQSRITLSSTDPVAGAAARWRPSGEKATRSPERPQEEALQLARRASRERHDEDAPDTLPDDTATRCPRIDRQPWSVQRRPQEDPLVPGSSGERNEHGRSCRSLRQWTPESTLRAAKATSIHTASRVPDGARVGFAEDHRAIP